MEHAKSHKRAYHNRLKQHLKRLYSNKALKRLVKPFPRYGKAVNIVVLLGFIMLIVAGAGSALTVYNKPTHIITRPTSSTDSNNCLLNKSGCPNSDSSSTPTTTTQPAQTTPSIPATTTTPKSSTPTSYPTVIDGVVWASSTCHYAPGYGEAYYRNDLVQSIQSSQTAVSNYWSDLLNQSSQNPGLMTDQQLLNDINQYITVTNSGIMSAYDQYVSNVNSIGCTETIDAAQIPQIQACTDISGCSGNIFGISIPSLE